MERVRLGAAWTVLGTVLAAPAVGGCQAPWAWGFLFAAVAVFSAFLLMSSFARPSPERSAQLLFKRPLCWLAWPAIGLLAWASISCIYDHFADSAADRTPALSVRALLFVWAFAAAFVAGLFWGEHPRRLRRLFALLSAAGALYASVAVAQWFGWGPTEILGWAIDRDRPSGVYTNPNRFAVLVSICWACALALFLALLLGLRRTQSRRKRLRRRIWLTVLFGVVLLLSAGVAVTLSRWTLISTAMAVSVATFAGVLRGRRQSPHAETAGVSWNPDEEKLSIIRLAGILFALAAPVVVVFALALTLAGRPLAARLGSINQPDESSRARAMRSGVKLLEEKPWMGWGLGGFERAFRPVQPLDFPGRWAQVHNDWLQVGVELGVPGLALALAAAAGLAFVGWKALPRRKRRARFWIFLGGGVALSIPLLASIADFPLREQAKALIYFFLAGACAAASARAAAERQIPTHQKSSFLAGVFSCVIAAGLLGLTFFAARIGWASAHSPWMGRIQPPPPRAEWVQGYRRALELEPSDVRLSYPCACSVFEALRSAPPNERPELRAFFEATLDSMRKADPRDYRCPQLEGECAAWEGDFARAAERLDEAVSLAPAYHSLRMQAAMLRLNGLFAKTPPMSVAANEQLRRVLSHLRVLLAVDPSNENTFVEAMRRAGALPIEIAELWPRENPASVLPRARYWASLRNWDLLEVELKGVNGRNEEPWIAALRGRVAFERNDIPEGISQWKIALAQAVRTHDSRQEWWLAREAETLSNEAVLAIAEKAPDETAGASNFALAIAARLLKERKLAAADALLERTAAKALRAEVYRAWAELALQLGDRASALSRARQAAALSNRSPEWIHWLEEFERAHADPGQNR